jgi:hypothetical protein
MYNSKHYRLNTNVYTLCTKYIFNLSINYIIFMKNQKTGLIFCSQIEQKTPINISSVKYFNSTRFEIGFYFDQYFKIEDEVIKSKLKKFFLKKALNDYPFYLRLIHSISPMNQEVFVSVSNSHALSSIFRYSTNNIKKARLGRQRMFDNVNFDFNIIYNGYNQSIRTVLNSSNNLKQFDNDIKKIKLFKKANSITKVTAAVKNIKDNVFNNFTQIVSNFFNDVLHSIIPAVSRRDFKNEIQVVGSKTYRESALVIDIPYERLAVINFIKKLGLEHFYSEHLNIPRMVEAIRMYELGEHKAFKEYTTYAVNRALIAIERKLLAFNDQERNIALQEMNNLDSLKFIVELITDDELLVSNQLVEDETYLALMYKN